MIRRVFAAAALGAVSIAALGCVSSTGAGAQDAAPRLTALNCGEIDVGDMNLFSDTDGYDGMTMTLSVPCFLIEHGDQKLLWDLGLPDSMAEEPGVGPAMALRVPRTLASQLAELDITPDDIDLIAVSHAHVDHAGNVNMFLNAQLIIQVAEWDAVVNGGTGPTEAAYFTEFLDGDGVLEVQGDYDIFGDGSVVTLFTPGHTPGHQALLVRPANTGPIILSGDWAHFSENRANQGVPDFNWNRAETLASLDRLEKLSANIGARIIIEHEPDDMATLPAFPQSLD